MQSAHPECTRDGCNRSGNGRFAAASLRRPAPPRFAKGCRRWPFRRTGSACRRTIPQRRRTRSNLARFAACRMPRPGRQPRLSGSGSDPSTPPQDRTAVRWCKRMDRWVRRPLARRSRRRQEAPLKWMKLLAKCSLSLSGPICTNRKGLRQKRFAQRWWITLPPKGGHVDPALLDRFWWNGENVVGRAPRGQPACGFDRSFGLLLVFGQSGTHS